MIESTALRFLNKRLAELSQQYQTRPTRNGIAEELSELTAIRDQLKGILERFVQRPNESQLSAEFPTLGAFVHRVNTLARHIARTRKDDPHRHDLLNEMTSLCFMADTFYKREL
jgi:ribosomal protein S15P/S13E